jgi:serine/threonine protein kinase/Flp pilus assembly protein TadD
MTEAEKENDRLPDKGRLDSTASFDSSEFGPGVKVGPYKLLSILGEGGFAVVYLAEQERPVRRRVALKVIKPGMDSKQVIARFEAERQALALLDHPNVARVYDAGTTKFGLPYFVMENVRGLPLTEHCDRHKLTIEERLKLFLQVCEAVQHAHHKGIIHRDIKPSNIQVCIEGEQFIPKVIDFGVAKALSQPLTERTLVTAQGQMIGTPEYMSPEQAEMTGQDVDTRTDIYSLGVLLYKLLVGTLPFKSEALREGGISHIRHVICEESPKTPSIQAGSLNVEESTRVAQCCQTDVSTLRRRLRGDLDWITLKAMEKDRMRRYQTAHALAEDIQRHLDHEPVLAGPPSKIYHLRKLLRKHRAHIVRAAITAILLTIIAVIFVMYRQAIHQATEAESLRHKEILSNAQQLRYSRQFQGALTQVETILNSKHVGLEARLLRARLILELQGPEVAVGEIEGLLNERGEIACPAHFLLAWIYQESDPCDPETRIEYQRKAKEHEQTGEKLFAQVAKTAEVYLNRATIAPTAEKTLEDLNKALELDRNHYDALKSRALAYYALRDYWKMQRDALAMTVIVEGNPLGYSLLAIALREMGDFTRAVEYHNKASTLSPDDPELYSQRYETYLRMGDYELALKDAQRCVEIEPEQFVYCFNLFAALVSLGDYEAARQQYRKIVGADSAHRQQFEEWVKRHVFEVLGSGHSLELPREEAQHEAFSAIREAADYYHRLKTKASRLVSGVYGQSGWSPDGKKLAYGRSELYAWQPDILAVGAPALFRSSGIEILDIESGATRLLVSFGKDPAWSPDGEHIVFVREPYRVREYKEELWIIPASGGEPRRLAQGGWPIWANDSKRVFFHSRTDETLCSIRIYDPASEAKRVISCPSRFPWISPDEKYIAYSEGNELKIVEIASGSVVTSWIAPDPAIGLLVRWSPNGKELSVSGFEGSDLGLWIFDMEHKKAWQIFDPPAISGIWSPHMSQMIVEIKVPFEENWLVRLDPNLPTHESLSWALSEQGYLRLRQEFYTGKFEEVIDTDRPMANMYIRKLAFLGMKQYRIGAYEHALETLTTVKKHRSEVYPPEVAFMAMALHQVGREQEARDTVERLRHLLKDGEYLLVEKYLHEAEQLLAGKNSKVYPLWDCIKEEKLNEASQLIEELRSLPLREDSETARSFQSAIEALARAYYKRGRCAKRRGDGYAETVADYRAAVSTYPNFARALSDLAYLQAADPEAEFHNGDRAIENATKACKMTGNNDYRYLGTLAAVYAELGDFVKAVECQKKAIDSMPADELLPLRACCEHALELYKSGRTYEKGNPCSFSTERLVARWRLDEDSGSTAADSSGSGCSGILVGSPQWQPSDGKVGGALEFDGYGDYIRIEHESIFDFVDEITIAAWVKIAAVPVDWTPIVTKGNSAWRLTTYRAQNKFHFFVSGVGFGSSWVDGKRTVDTGEWHHVTGTYDGANIRLYVDGVEDQASSYSGRMTSNDFDVCIGANSEKPGRYWKGCIDDVRIYNYALSPQDIRVICNGEDSSPAED